MDARVGGAGPTLHHDAVGPTAQSADALCGRPDALRSLRQGLVWDAFFNQPFIHTILYHGTMVPLFPQIF